MFWEGESTVGKRVWQSSALLSPVTTVNRHAIPIGDDIESVGDSRVDVETGNEEKKEIEKLWTYCLQELVCCLCQRSLFWETSEPFEEEEKERTKLPSVSFDGGFSTQENTDRLPVLICRDNRHGQIPLLVDLIKDLESLRIILKDENEPSLKIFQEVIIYSCVEVVVRGKKRKCRILMTSDEHNTSVRITDDISLLNWILHFAMQFLNDMRTGRRWRQSMAQFGEEELI